MEKIKELQREKEEHLKESKNSYQKLIAHQESELLQEEETGTAKQKQPKHRVSVCVHACMYVCMCHNWGGFGWDLRPLIVNFMFQIPRPHYHCLTA